MTDEVFFGTVKTVPYIAPRAITLVGRDALIAPLMPPASHRRTTKALQILSAGLFNIQYAVFLRNRDPARRT